MKSFDEEMRKFQADMRFLIPPHVRLDDPELAKFQERVHTVLTHLGKAVEALGARTSRQ